VPGLLTRWLRSVVLGFCWGPGDGRALKNCPAAAPCAAKQKIKTCHAAEQGGQATGRIFLLKQP